MLLISFLSWDLQPHSALNWSCIFSVNFCDKVRTVFFFRFDFKEKHFVSTKGKQEYYNVSFKTFYLRIASMWIVPRYLDVWTIRVHITLSSPSSLETSAPWKKKMEKKNIVIRGGWLWKATNIKYKNHSAKVYVGSSLKVHNPLFSVGKLRRNKMMRRFYWSVRSKC